MRVSEIRVKQIRVNQGLGVCRNHQIGGEDFVHFCSLLRKHELYE